MALLSFSVLKGLTKEKGLMRVFTVMLLKCKITVIIPLLSLALTVQSISNRDNAISVLPFRAAWWREVNLQNQAIKFIELRVS